MTATLLQRTNSLEGNCIFEFIVHPLSLFCLMFLLSSIFPTHTHHRADTLDKTNRSIDVDLDKVYSDSRSSRQVDREPPPHPLSSYIPHPCCAYSLHKRVLPELSVDPSSVGTLSQPLPSSPSRPPALPLAHVYDPTYFKIVCVMFMQAGWS